MIWSLIPLQDTAIYESDPYRNAGLDQILELRKDGDSSTGDLTESRILLKFDISGLSSILSDNGLAINSISASLRLHTVQESQLPQTYTLEAKPISTNWVNGTGYALYPPDIFSNQSITDGATWISAAGTGSATWSSSYVNSSGTNLIYNDSSSIGGGVWHTSSIASQSFTFKTDDVVDIDVTSMVKNWYNSTFTNNGMLVTFNHNQIISSSYPETNIQFYSSDTHTVFSPQLFISWTGSIAYNTGSLSVITYEDSPVIYARSYRGEFFKDKKIRILLGARPRYPRASFAQNSVFLTTKALPQNCYYQIKDAHNNEIIIPYSQYTKINTNSSGSYFDIYTTMLYAERYYRFEIKAEFTDVTEYFDSNEFTFKIIK